MTAIIAALSVLDPILGEFPDWVREWMALSEPVKLVQAENTQIMSKSTRHGQWPNDLRADTGTYQWVSASIRDVLSNPYAVSHGNKPRTYQLIGKVRPPTNYPTIQYLRLVLKYVPRAQALSGGPEMLLISYTPHSEDPIKPHLRGAWIFRHDAVDTQTCRG